MNTGELIEMGEKCRTGTADEAGGLFPPSMYYRFFERLAASMKPRLAVVLGVCGGGDCWHLAKGSPETKVIGVDIARDHPEQIAFIEKNCPNFFFWEGDSVASAGAIRQAHGNPDFLFIDTTHFQEQTMAEWEAWRGRLAPGAVVAFDDIFRPGMQEFWDTLPEPKVRMDYLHDGTYPHGGGFGVLILPEAQGYAEAVKAPDYDLGN
jgi:predicted O-methyltransferase YrrM